MGDQKPPFLPNKQQVDPGQMPSSYATQHMISSNPTTRVIRISLIEEIVGGHVVAACVTMPMESALQLANNIIKAYQANTRPPKQSEGLDS